MQGAKGCDIPPSIADLGGMTALPGQLRRLDIAMLLARNGAANEGGRTRLKKDLYMFDVNLRVAQTCYIFLSGRHNSTSTELGAIIRSALDSRLMV